MKNNRMNLFVYIRNGQTTFINLDRVNFASFQVEQSQTQASVHFGEDFSTGIMIIGDDAKRLYDALQSNRGY